MEKLLPSNEGILHTRTFQGNASDKNSREAEVYQLRYEENVVINNFNVMPGQSIELLVTYLVDTWSGYM